MEIMYVVNSHNAAAGATPTAAADVDDDVVVSTTTQAEVLRLGGIDVQISYLELLDNNIASRGALALGNSLGRHNNLSLLTLKLDYNTTLGDEGCANLCRGLRTNGTLKQVRCYG